jgi:hypothetical protein
MQQNADEDGFIKGTAIHKNHKANLMALCEECHLKQHKQHDVKNNNSTVEKTVIKKIIKKKTTVGYLTI